MSDERLELTETERLSPLWQKIEAHYLERLKTLRKRNDSPKLDQHDTTVLRGRIKEIKDFLALGGERSAPYIPEND